MTAGKERKADSCMVFEPAVLHRINRSLQIGSGCSEPVEHGTEPRPLGARAGRQIEAIEGSEGGRGGTGGGKQWLEQLPRLPGDSGNRGSVLVVERRTQCGGPLAADIVCLGNRRHQCRQCDVDGEVRHAQRSKRLSGDCDRLDVGARLLGTNQLAAHLADLPLGPDFRASNPQHLSGVAEPQWARGVAESGCGDPRNLRGHIGA